MEVENGVFDFVSELVVWVGVCIVSVHDVWCIWNVSLVGIDTVCCLVEMFRLKYIHVWETPRREREMLQYIIYLKYCTRSF